MKSSPVLVKLSLSIACLIWGSVVVFAQDPALVRHFDYDAAAPLELKIIGTQKRDEATIYDITYASPKGGVVPAYLVVPVNGKGPFAAVIWGHWYWTNSEMRNRKQFLHEAVALASAGVVSLLTDGPIARPDYVPDNTPMSEKRSAEEVQQVIDMRRGADLLLARKDVDPKRLAYVGHSYNASIGAILSGVDRRFKAFVLMAGPISDEVGIKTGGYEKFRQQVGAGEIRCVHGKPRLFGPGQIRFARRAGRSFSSVRDEGRFYDAGGCARVREDRQRSEAIQTLRRATCIECGSQTRSYRVSNRAVETETAAVKGH